jgi:predicted GNAT family N-acyltransferase
LKVLLLDKTHNRSDFHCEEESLNQYIQKQVSQDIKKRLSVCFVILDNLNNVIGYYTLATESLERDEIPEKYRKKIPKNYNVPAILLGRLARDISQKRNGIGEFLLLDALFRSYRMVKENIGAMAVVTEPINKKATIFYSRYGFIDLPDSNKMFIPMNVIAKLI